MRMLMAAVVALVATGCGSDNSNRCLLTPVVGFSRLICKRAGTPCVSTCTKAQAASTTQACIDGHPDNFMECDETALTSDGLGCYEWVATPCTALGDAGAGAMCHATSATTVSCAGTAPGNGLDGGTAPPS